MASARAPDYDIGSKRLQLSLVVLCLHLSDEDVRSLLAHLVECVAHQLVKSTKNREA